MIRHLLVVALLAAAATLNAQDRSRGVAPAAASTAVKPQKSAEEAARELEHYRAVAGRLAASRKAAVALAAANELRAGFPASRPVLLEMLKRSSIRSRIFAAQILGEKGNIAADLEPVAALLDDPDHRVRLAAATAIRALGPEGLDKLVEYLPTEVKSNNRKMAVNTLKDWRDKKAIPHLARLLQREKEKTVRNFIVKALESLSGEKFGQDVEAWASYADAWEQQQLARKILEHKKGASR